MKQYIKRSWLVILGYVVFAIGLLLNLGRPIHGDVLIPLILIYSALVLRERSGTSVQHRRTSA
jgi:hypothetical protein